MTNWKTTISGACAAAGTFIFGAPIAFEVLDVDIIPKPWLKFMVVGGFLMQGVGIFCAHLFSADAKQVQDLSQKIDDNTSALITGDTTHLVNPNKSLPETPDASKVGS